MKKTRPNFRDPWIGKCVLSLIIAVGFVGTSFAQQFDAPYYDLQKKNNDKWATEDRQIDQRLAEIRARNGGKRPNIVYILVDDMGFGEFGMPALNKIRGGRTPNLDKFAQEGMWFSASNPRGTDLSARADGSPIVIAAGRGF